MYYDFIESISKQCATLDPSGLEDLADIQIIIVSTYEGGVNPKNHFPARLVEIQFNNYCMFGVQVPINSRCYTSQQPDRVKGLKPENGYLRI